MHTLSKIKKKIKIPAERDTPFVVGELLLSVDDLWDTIASLELKIIKLENQIKEKE